MLKKKNSSMMEGPVPRSKRMGARFFKNPPQPHMCIRDYLKESWHACYINVLSWDKIEMASCPSEGLRLYGGMKINPPRTENPQSAVFFVMANPEILRQNGKNAQDLKEQSSLIELLLDFVETMNEGVVFKRLYKILDDRDITGELKEIWSIVQSDKAKLQDTFGSEDVMRPVPQYQHYQQDHQQNQQKHQQQQQQQQQQKIHHKQQPQYRQPPPQQHQHQLQQMQTQHQQPPQYHYNYPMPNRGPVDNCDNYDLRYTRQNQIVNNPQNDRIYQPRLGANQKRSNCKDRIFKYEQYLPRQMGPPYPVPNCHPNPNLGCPNMINPVMPPVINHGVNPGPQIHYVSMHALDNSVFVKLHRMQQPQQPQLQLAHASPVRQYETIDTYYDPQANAQLNFMNIFRPQTNLPMNNSSNKRQINSLPYGNCSNIPPPPVVNEIPVKIPSPVKVLQRDSSVMTPNRVQIYDETARNVSVEKKMVQVTDLDEDEPRGQIINDCDGVDRSESVEVEKSTSGLSSEVMSAGTESCDNSPQQSTSVSNAFGRDRNHKKQGKTKITVLKRNNNGYSDGNKSAFKNDKAINNGATCEIERENNHEINEKIVDNEKLESEKANDLISGADRNGYADKKQIDFDECTKGTPNTRRMQKNNSNTSTINNNEQNEHINGQPKNNGKKNDEVFHQVYTILKKPESISSQDEVTKEIAQLSMKECTDSSKIGAAFS